MDELPSTAGLEVRIGDFLIEGAVLSRPVGMRENQVEEAELVIPVRAVAIDDEPVDYAGRVSIRIGPANSRQTNFGGFIDRATLEDDHLRVRVVSGTTSLAEQNTGGITISRDTTLPQVPWLLEMAWAMLRMAGVPEEKIEIGFTKSEAEPFRVTVPIDGIELDAPLVIGPVRFSTDNDVRHRADRYDYEELKQQYRNHAAWADTRVWAQAAYDAETRGLKKIDDALSWLYARSRYSTARLPDDRPQTFHRDSLRTRVRRAYIVEVRGEQTRRAYLRGLGDTHEHAPLNPNEVFDFGFPVLADELSQQEREALTFFRQAVDADEPLTKLVLISTALEFYAAGMELPDVFERTELRAARKRAVQGVTPSQAERINQVMALANDVSFAARLNGAMQRDRVIVTDFERKVLKGIRQTRNDLVHGSGVDIPDDDDLRVALAVVARLLVYRMSARS